MVLVIRYLYQTLIHDSYKYSDVRTVKWPLLANPINAVIIVIVYLYFVQVWGPKFMREREPYELKYVLMFYNVAQVVLTSMLGFYGSYLTFWKANYSLMCQPLTFDEDDVTMEILRASYFFFLLKIVDFFDTIFFVLRKNNRQVSFLHLFHHTSSFVGTYVGLKYFPAAHANFMAILNCFEHTIMYFYYFLTAFRPELKKSIWWKKHITQMQMLHFLIFIIHFGRPLIMGDCDYPKSICFLVFCLNLFVLILFTNFYVKTYNKNKKEN